MSADKKPDQDRRPDQLFPGLGGVYRDAAPYLTLGIQLAAAVVVFFLLGWWLDTRYDTSPTFKLVGLTVGSVGGLIKFLKAVTALGKKDKPS